jgi:hypothetical protein
MLGERALSNRLRCSSASTCLHAPDAYFLPSECCSPIILKSWPFSACRPPLYKLKPFDRWRRHDRRYACSPHADRARKIRRAPHDRGCLYAFPRLIIHADVANPGYKPASRAARYSLFRSAALAPPLHHEKRTVGVCTRLARSRPPCKAFFDSEVLLTFQYRISSTGDSW